MYLEDLTPEMQKIVLQGNSIYLMEQGFKDYLKSYNINIEDFKKKGRADKADILVKMDE